jgi:rare lipoprotein A
MLIWVFASVGTHSPIPANAEVTMRASYYDEKFQGRPMANSKPFDWRKMTVAHRDLPLGTKVLLTNSSPEKRTETIVATVTDRGPFVSGRDIDVSKGVAKKLKLKMGDHGTAPVTVQVLE